jgi:hypothetical protein
MNDDEYPDDNDSTLTAELRDCLAEVAVPGRPSLAAITGRGRAHRRRWLASFAGPGGASAAVVVALALGPAGVFGAAPARTGTVRTAAFTLISYTNGIVALKLSQVFDPAALQRALAQHGIPALAKTDTYCSSIPAVPAPVGRRVLSIPRGSPDILQTGNWPVKPSQLAPFDDPVTMVLDGAAMPSGTELFIGNFDLGHTIFAGVIYTGSHICVEGQRPPAVARLDRPPSAGPG